MRSLHLTIAVAIALLVPIAAYPVYEHGKYRGSDWEAQYGDKQPREFTYSGSRSWVRPETRRGYEAHAVEKESTEAPPKAKRVVEDVEEKDLTPVKDVSELGGLAETDMDDEFGLESILFLEETAEEPVMPPWEQPAWEPAPFYESLEYEFYLELYYEPSEAPSMPAPEPEYYYYPIEEPYYPPAYPPMYPPVEAPVPALVPEVEAVVMEQPPPKRAKKHKKAAYCEKGPCPCECPETKTPCYCYPQLPKRQYPSYYVPQYSPYMHYGQVYSAPYYEPEPSLEPKKAKKVKLHPAEPEPVEEEPVKLHKKPKGQVHPKPEEEEPVVLEPKVKHKGHKKEAEVPAPTKVGVYPMYGYPHGKYGSTYKHFYYGPQEEVPMYCKPPHSCEEKKHPGHQYMEATHPEHEAPGATKKKKCRRCRKCKRCGPCVEDEHGCAQETHDSDVQEKL